MGYEVSERIPLTSHVIEINSAEDQSPSGPPENKNRMWFNPRKGLSAICLCLLFLSILVALAASQRGKFVNCKKMVFAPICRGVAAKRAAAKVHYQTQPQFSYPLSAGNQFVPSDKQTPYWFYQTRLAERTYP